MRNFEYRKPRWNTQFEIDFCVKEQMFRGVCTDVSDAGIRAVLAGAVPMGSIGELTLRHPKHLVTLDAIVAHLEPGQVGLTFLLRTPAQRGLAGQFLAVVRKRALVS